MKDRMAQVGAGTRQRRGIGHFGFGGKISGREVRSAVLVENAEDIVQVFLARRFVNRNAQRMFVDAAEIHPVRVRQFQNSGGAAFPEIDADRIEEGEVSSVGCRGGSGFGIFASRWADLVAKLSKAGRENDGKQMDALGNVLQTVRTMITSVHRRHAGQQRLGRANVAGRFLAANVLFTGLQRQAKSSVAPGIFGHANDAAWHVAFESVPRRKVRRVRTAVPQRNAKTLRTANRDVGPELARRPQQSQTQQIRGYGDQSAGLMRLRHQIRVIMNFTVSIGILDQRSENLVVEGKVFVVANPDFNSQRAGTSLDYLDGLWMARTGNKKTIPPFLQSMRQGHRFRGGGGFIQQRSIGHWKAG